MSRLTRRTTVAVTGATGLIGRALCESLAASGYSVRAFTRRPDPHLSSIAGVVRADCDLPERFDTAALSECDVLIHAAYVTRFRNIDEARRINEDGTLRLLAASRAVGVKKFVFISTTSAHAQAASYYGQSKLRLEAALDPRADLVIRPGLVLSRRGGLFGRLARARPSWLPFPVPLFDGGTQPMQTIHLDDLLTGCRRALESDMSGSLTIAAPEHLTIREFFQAVADYTGRKALFVSMPLNPSLRIMQLMESLHVPIPVSSENLLGLSTLKYWDTTSDLSALDLHVRSLAQSLASLSTP